MTITFVTLFLSLINGIHPVQVAVNGPVARVEIVLDEHLVTVLRRPPWTTPCNFGPLLMPHELLAVAYDADGKRLAEARQLVNLPRPPVEAGIILVSDDNGVPVRARVFWESAEAADPEAVTLTFDGLLLAPDSEEGYPLPSFDASRSHIVSAEVQLADGVSARSDVTFGGRYGARVAAELTGVPVLFAGRPLSVDRLEGALTADGEELTPVAVERPGARVLLVRDQRALPELAAASRRGPVISHRAASQAARLAPGEDRVQEVLAHAVRRRERTLFPTSPGISLDRFDLAWLVAHLAGDEEPPAREQLTDAVAVAGVQAAGQAAPRAVLLVVSGTAQDRSAFRPAEVRRYLESLRVPLYVWSTTGDGDPGWGPVADVSRRKGLARAARDLMRELERQRIVWVRGTHMINRVERAADAEGFTLAGVPAASE